MNTAPVGSPVQYVNTKDCSQGFCTLYCPQWCYIVFPPPSSSFGDQFPNEGSGPNFSPLVITIIVVLAGAFLLVSYYAIVLKYCIRRVRTGSRENGLDDQRSVNDGDPVAAVEPWFIPSNGLDEAMIKSIAVFKYTKAENYGLSHEMTDCIVCLSEFREHDSLRRLPKCNHAFHVPCIDTWLKSHSTCPLCRSNVVLSEDSSSSSSLSMPLDGTVVNHGETTSMSQVLNAETTLIEIRDVNEDRDWGVRRSVSMDCIPDHHRVGDDEFCEMGERGRNGRREGGECGMKRSHSSGRWFLSKNGKRIIPL